LKELQKTLNLRKRDDKTIMRKKTLSSIREMSEVENQSRISKLDISEESNNV
jgi:hypothetical protein